MWFIQKRILYIRLYAVIRFKAKCDHKTACKHANAMVSFAEHIRRLAVGHKQLKGVTK